jgi:putative restriction endonuclease
MVMAFGVFIHRTDSIYDDSPAERYQFPGQYLERARACVGDWILYYEPVKVADTRGYFAVAKVSRIVPDKIIPKMHVAIIEPGTYLDFVNPVPFRRHGELVETGLLNLEGDISGRAQAAVRTISPADFNRILALGIDDRDPVLPRTGSLHSGLGFEEEQAPFIFEHQHDRVSYLASRAVRDRLFRRLVLKAYGERCAITGLKLINGGGRAEVDAAHIRPVEANGPDIVTNGLALSGTAHWMFDRGLISLSNELDILVSRQVNDADAVWAFVNKSRRAHLPNRPMDRPHSSFLEWHRNNCFKG